MGDEDFLVRHIFENYFAIVGRMDVFFHFICGLLLFLSVVEASLVGRLLVMACKFRHFWFNSQTFAEKSSPSAEYSGLNPPFICLSETLLLLLYQNNITCNEETALNGRPGGRLTGAERRRIRQFREIRQRCHPCHTRRRGIRHAESRLCGLRLHRCQGIAPHIGQRPEQERHMLVFRLHFFLRG